MGAGGSESQQLSDKKNCGSKFYFGTHWPMLAYRGGAIPKIPLTLFHLEGGKKVDAFLSG